MRDEVINKFVKNNHIENIVEMEFENDCENYLDVQFQDEIAVGECVRCYPIGPIKRHLNGTVSQIVRFELETPEKTAILYAELKKRGAECNS